MKSEIINNVLSMKYCTCPTQCMYVCLLRICNVDMGHSGALMPSTALQLPPRTHGSHVAGFLGRTHPVSIIIFNTYHFTILYIHS